MFRVLVVGVATRELTKSRKALLSTCRLVVGSKRMLDMAAPLCPQTLELTPLDVATSAIRSALRQGNVGVMASGDPLFFGIGRRLLNEFGAELVEIHPTLSSMQEAMSRFKIPWDDARMISLHGRRSPHAAGLLLTRPKNVVFTDKINSPDFLARQLIDYLQLIEAHDILTGCRAMVAENIGYEAEKMYSGTLQEVAERSFADLNVFCLLPPTDIPQGRLGLTEKELAHSRGLITKNEVRAITLHCLRLPDKGVFWDVGAGSGSVSIEAARLNPDLTIYAIERKQEELANIKENIRRHGCYNVVPVAGPALELLAGLPNPHRVFIGGNGGQLAGIIAEAAKRLPKDGVLVANGVIPETVAEAPKLMSKAGLRPRISAVNITRTEQDCEPVIFNQISIITGEKSSSNRVCQRPSAPCEHL